MDTQLIECKKIEFLKNAPGQNPFNKEFAEKLAITIKTEGMHHAIVVRPNPEKPGFYIGVSGRHRHYAKTKVLKEQFIEAKVFPDMDEEDAEMARISENLWRNPVTKVQHVATLKRWYELYILKHGEKPKGFAGGDATRKKAEAKKALAEATEVEAAVVASRDKAEPAAVGAHSFAQMAAAATGRSTASIYKDTKLGKSFDAEQFEAFEQMKVSKADMATIAKIKDVKKRGEVVSLIAAGMEPEDALKDVMKDEAPTREDGKSKETREAEAAAKEDKQPKLSDDEWFATYCGEKAAMFRHPEKFKADAILYRRIIDGHHDFRVKNKKYVAEIKAGGITGAFWNLVNRFISISHPKDWGICIECKGTGEGPGGLPHAPAKCPKCYGGGFHLKTENYL